MDVNGRIAVVTGAAGGIGKALALKFHEAGAKLVVAADRNEDGAKQTAKEIGGIAFGTDVSKESEIIHLIETVESAHGPIDLFCSNAGIGALGGVEAPNERWQLTWEVNVMAHVWAARHLVPKMVARGGGYLFSTASAAGLTSQIGSATYAVTKHAAVALAEWLAITHGDQGIKVSVLCPQAVRTAMMARDPNSVAAIDGMLEPDMVADICLQAIEKEEFMILPHPEVIQYFRNKANDYGRWIGGMRKLNRRFGSKT
jgi:NAD(P)-dependent dehydrogenase (short-subunit alcohol dehydrogenase family)